MILNQPRRGFSLVELMVVIAIIGALGTASYAGGRSVRENSLNRRVNADLLAITNALEQYRQDYNQYPMPQPGGNMNLICAGADTSPVHDCDLAAYRQSMIDNRLLTKRYLSQVPTDPRTGSRYAYGVTGDGEAFQLAGNVHKGGAVSAKTRGNLVRAEWPLPGIIRAYNGPGFVKDGGTKLPYSPEHLEITARLEALAGVVSVMDADGSPIDPSETMRAGYTVTVGAGGRAMLYFSDGSVSTLDDSTSDTSLTILPASEIAENDADGIITKIRLKLLSGTMWNKVVRLAERSEFNVETTSAIAGVRGTEFGIKMAAGAGGADQLMVYAGEVWVAQDTAPNRVTVASGQAPQQADITVTGPRSAGPVSSPALLNEIDQLRANEQLHAGIVPYIVAATFTVSGPYMVYVSFNAATVEDVFSIDGFEVFGHGQFEEARYRDPSAMNTPLIEVTSVSYDAGREAYGFPLDYDDPLLLSNSWYTASPPTAHDPIHIRAYQQRPNGTRAYSALSFSGVGLANQRPVADKDWDFSPYTGLPSLPGGNTPPVVIPPPIITLASVCTPANSALWYLGGCWIESVAGESCGQACRAFGDVYEVEDEADCQEGDWNADTAVCDFLGYPIDPTPQSQVYAPIVNAGSCILRNTAHPSGDFDDQDCDALAFIGPFPQPRVCKCE